MTYKLFMQSVASVAFSPDSKLIAAGGRDNVIKIFDVVHSAVKHVLQGHLKCVCTIIFSSNGNFLVSGSSDKTISIWDPIKGKLISTLHGHKNRVRCVAISPKHDVIASGGDDKTVVLWDTIMGDAIHTLHGHTTAIQAVSFNHDGSRLASAGLTLRLWDTHTGMLLNVLRGGLLDPVGCLDFTLDNTCLVSGSDDCTIKVWNVETGDIKMVIQKHAGRVFFIACIQDNIISAATDNTIIFWNSTSYDIVQTLQQNFGILTCLSVSPNKTLLATGDWDGNLYVHTIPQHN